MKLPDQTQALEPERYELAEAPRWKFDRDRLELDRRDFLKVLGAGLLITVAADGAFGQAETGTRRGGRGGGAFGQGTRNIAARLHIGEDGAVTVLCGKVEFGQGALTEVQQAAAEELRLPLDKVQVTMYDSSVSPNDGGTFGSQTTPRTVPQVRRAAAAAAQLLWLRAAKEWGDQAALVWKNGTIVSGDKTMTYGDLAKSADAAESLRRDLPQDVALTPVGEWKVLGTSVVKPTMADIVTGKHQYPSDIRLPGMLYGRIVRPVSFGATLESIDLAPAQALSGVSVVRDGDFVGCAAPTTFEAAAAADLLAKSAQWKETPQVSAAELFEHLKKTAQGDSDAVAAVPNGGKGLKSVYTVPYIAHVPMETRAAVAEWSNGGVTVWTASQNPGSVRGALAQAFGLAEDRVRVIIPDSGGGFGGKHTGECAVEAARLARAAGKPVSLHWTRAEEMTWAYFRPAGVMEAAAGLDAQGKIAAWSFVNINSGNAGVESPYDIAAKQDRFVRADSPLRQGSYRSLAAAANHFARESFMDELALLAGQDPLAFRMAHLSNERIKGVLAAAAEKFAWNAKREKTANSGVGMACGTDKGSFVAAMAEVQIENGAIKPLRIVVAFECGKIMNPANLRRQVEGGVVMGLGGALSEEIDFADGQVKNNKLARYHVPRLADLPRIELVLLDRPDLDSVGAGETPIIGVAPALANAVADATGERLRGLPLNLKA